MVDVTIRGGLAIVEPRGLHKLWTLTGQVRVPLERIREARRATSADLAGLWKGWRLPGTHIPGVIVAGTYYRDGERIFWDVEGQGQRAVVVELEGAEYDRLIVDVRDPDDVIARLSSRTPPAAAPTPAPGAGAPSGGSPPPAGA